LLPWTPLAVAGDVGRLLHGVSAARARLEKRARRAPAFRSISAATRLVAECFAHALGVLLSHEANWCRKFMSRIFSRQISPRSVQCKKKTKIRLLGHTGSDLQETLLAGNNSVINENKAITNREKTHNIVQTNRINSLDLALLQEPFKRLNTRMSAIKCKSQRCGVVCSFLDSFDSGNAI